MATPDYTIDKKQTVQGQLDDLISQNNPLMQKAKTAGTQYANQRGLLNSSIGAGATQSALMDYALPIAQADANTQNQFASQQYNTNLQKDLNQQAQDFTTANMATEQQYNIANMDKAATIDTDMAKLNNQFNLESMQKQADINADVTAKTTSANTQGEYMKSVDDIVNNAMVSINEIEIAEGITQDEKNTMIENTIKRRDADLAFTKQLYSNMPTWDFSWIDTADNAMPAAPGVTA